MRRLLQLHVTLFLLLAAASAVREGESTAEMGGGGGGAVAVLEILRPQHHTVVRTQSVEIAVISSPGSDVTIHVDGKLIATVPGGRQFSVILAEEGLLSEGIHEVTVRRQVEGKVQEVSTIIYSQLSFALPCNLPCAAPCFRFLKQGGALSQPRVPTSPAPALSPPPPLSLSVSSPLDSVQVPFNLLAIFSPRNSGTLVSTAPSCRSFA
jgi:hypothetical protein